MGTKDLGEPEFGLRAHSTEWWRPPAAAGGQPSLAPWGQPSGQPDSGGGSARGPARFGGWLSPISGVAGHSAGHSAGHRAGRWAGPRAGPRPPRPSRGPALRARDGRAGGPARAYTCGHGQDDGCIGERGGSRGCARCRRASTRRSGFLSLTPRRQSPHRDPPSCRAHPCIPRLPVSQCVFAAFCAARGHVPTKAQVESAFKKWGTESGFKLITTQKVAGREVWKQRPSSKLTCAAAPPCTRPPPRPYQPAGRR